MRAGQCETGSQLAFSGIAPLSAPFRVMSDQEVSTQTNSVLRQLTQAAHWLTDAGVWQEKPMTLIDDEFIEGTLGSETAHSGGLSKPC